MCDIKPGKKSRNAKDSGRPFVFRNVAADTIREGQERFRTLNTVTNSALTLNARLGRRQEHNINGYSSINNSSLSAKSVQSYASSKRAPLSELKAKKSIIKSLKYLHHFVVPKGEKKTGEQLKRKIRGRFEKFHNGNQLSEERLDNLLPGSNVHVSLERTKMEDHKFIQSEKDEPELLSEYFAIKSVHRKNTTNLPE